MVKFNNKARPKTKEGKPRKQNTFNALYEGRELTANVFIRGIFPIKEKQGKRLKALTLKKMYQRLQIAFAQVKTDNTTENLLNEIKQIIYFPYKAKEIIKIYIII